MPTADLAPLGSQQAPQHPRAGERELQVQSVETPHDRKLGFRHAARTENIGGPALELRFPRCDLIGVDVELLRQLSQRSIAQRAGTLRYMGPPRPGPLLNRLAKANAATKGRRLKLTPVQKNRAGQC
jgi:hypothetical protein